jgi:retron-type reverse transcriptase
MKNYLSFWLHSILERNYNETDRIDLLAHLENLQDSVINRKVGHFIINTKQSECLGHSSLYSDLSFYKHPQINSKLLVEFGLPVNGKERVLLKFNMGESRCIFQLTGTLTNEEKVIFREIFPLNYNSKNWRLAFSSFSEKINFIIDFVAKKDKIIVIDLLREKIKTLLSKDQSEAVINELRIAQNKLRKLKKEFDKEYGYVYSL